MTEPIKSCLMRVSLEGLAATLNVAPMGRVVNVFRDFEDIKGGSVSVLLEGVGEPHVEGAHIKYVDPLSFARTESANAAPPDIQG